MDDGHTEKARVALFTGGLEVTETGVSLGVLQVERFLAAGHGADQPLPYRQRHLAHRLGSQADGLHQHQRIAFAVKQVERTDIGLHRLACPAHQGRQRRVQAARAVDLLNDSLQDLEHGKVSPLFLYWSGHGATER